VSLKNASIDIIRNYAPDAFLTRPVHDTTKGTVALMAPTAGQRRRRQLGQRAPPGWSCPATGRSRRPPHAMGSGAAFLQIADNAMNYHILGARGFEAVGRTVDQLPQLQLRVQPAG
jgi:hypothetical protein